jgi:nucleoside-diphosphate-sugar epimerase
VARRAFLLGGSGQTGRALIPRLQQRGWDVIVASRGERDGSPGVEHVTVDRTKEGALADAVGDGPDEIGRAIAANLDHEWAEVLIDEPVGDVGETVWSTPHPVVLDMTDAEFELGYRPVTTYEQAVPETVSWLVEATRGRDWRKVLPRSAEIMDRSFDYAAEDELIKSLTAG